MNIWAKPNPLPESVRDRTTVAHSYVLQFAKRPRYFFDQEAVREANSLGSIERFGITDEGQTRKWQTENNKRDGRSDGTKGTEGFRDHVPVGRNLRLVWTIATEGFPEAHFATWPQKLAEQIIKCATSERGKRPECGSAMDPRDEARRDGGATENDRLLGHGRRRARDDSS